MTEEHNEIFFDLLTKKAIHGLDEREERELDRLDAGTAASELHSLEMTAAAITMAGVTTAETMPSDLRARIIADSHDHVGLLDTLYTHPRPVLETVTNDRPAFGSMFGWLGWIAAAAAFSAFMISMFVLPRGQKAPVAAVQPVATTTPSPSMADQREKLIATANDIVRAKWTPGNVSELKGVSGDVVWSDEKQTGYMSLHGLPVNDATKTCYQLWIFDQTQDKATPIDGGIFDVTADGDLVVPIRAELPTAKPEMFALTLERHGGVVVSKRDKIIAIAKVEAQSS